MDATNAAERLLREHAEGVRFKPFAEAAGIVTIADAYAVQRAYVRLLERAHASRGAGYKIGLTTPRMQAMCGIDTPVGGVVLASRLHRSGVTLERSRYSRFGIEFEIAVRFGRDLVPRGDGRVAFDDVAAAVDGVCASIEVVDDRHCDYRELDVRSLVADNSWNAGLVLGEFVNRWGDLAAAEGTLYTDGASEPLDRGFGSAVLGHPFTPLVWLAGHLATEGKALRAGDVVTTGSIVTTKFPDRPGHWRWAVAGLGEVALDVV